MWIEAGELEMKLFNNYLEPQIVLITGATGGLGKAFAVECASRGWDLVLTDREMKSLIILANGLRKNYKIQVKISNCNLTDAGDRRRWLECLRTSADQFTMLINVAGIDHEGLFLDQSNAQVQNIIQLNIAATVDLTHNVLTMRNKEKTFRIINVSSLSAFYPMPVKALYSATKRFLLNFSLALREELRSQNASVTVLCPAGMPTNADCIKAIEAQGFPGEITTMDVGRVAYQTLNAALKGKAVVIPGWINRVLRSTGSLIPATLLARMIGRRWIAVHEVRRNLGTLTPLNK
jgi:short-subunit dehydrogenase